MEIASQSQSIPKKRLFVIFQKLFIIFWIFSFLGHYLEIVWSWLNHIMLGSSLWMPNVPTIVPLAPPYGLGVVAVIVITWPLIKKHELNPMQSFALNTVICAVVEYFSAAFLVLVDGYNKYWNYSDQSFNLNGYICLENCLLFGLGITVFIYYVYPIYIKIVGKFNSSQLYSIFCILFVVYVIDLILINFR